jgi:hypothetical protein
VVELPVVEAPPAVAVERVPTAVERVPELFVPDERADELLVEVDEALALPQATTSLFTSSDPSPVT